MGPLPVLNPTFSIGTNPQLVVITPCGDWKDLLLPTNDQKAQTDTQHRKPVAECYLVNQIAGSRHQSTVKLSSIMEKEIRDPETYFLPYGKIVPNNPLPALIYRNVLPQPLDRDSAKVLCEGNHWEKRVSNHL